MLHGSPKILLIRLSAIGDVVRVLPALHALRQAYPDAQIDWAVEPKSAGILEERPDLDQIWRFERASGWRGVRTFDALRRRLRIEAYDIALDFHGILKSGLLLQASGAPRRIGFARPRAREFSAWFANERVRLASDRLNRLEENLALLGPLGLSDGGLEVDLHLPQEAADDVEAFFLENFDAGKAVAAVHPAVDRPEKQWPVERFGELVEMLLADGRFEVLITWGPGQLELARAVAARVRRGAVVAPETPSLMHYAALVQRAHLYVGGDTGPMHVAAAAGVPVVAVFGGTDPVRHAPLQTAHRVLYAGPEPPPRRLPLAEARAALEAVLAEAVHEACVGLLFGEANPEGAAKAGGRESGLGEFTPG